MMSEDQESWPTATLSDDRIELRFAHDCVILDIDQAERLILNLQCVIDDAQRLKKLGIIKLTSEEISKGWSLEYKYVAMGHRAYVLIKNGIERVQMIHPEKRQGIFWLERVLWTTQEVQEVEEMFRRWSVC